MASVEAIYPQESGKNVGLFVYYLNLIHQSIGLGVKLAVRQQLEKKISKISRND